MHSAFIWRGKRHAEQRRPRYRFLGHAVWLSEDCAVAIVSVVRTGSMAWLFILSAVAWPEVGVRSASRTQAAVRRLWGKVALRRVWARPRLGHAAWRWLEAHTLVIEVVLKSSRVSR